MAPLSKTANSSLPVRSTSVGVRPLGLMARCQGSFCSFAWMLIRTTPHDSASSSSAIATFQVLGVSAA